MAILLSRSYPYHLELEFCSLMKVLLERTYRMHRMTCQKQVYLTCFFPGLFQLREKDRKPLNVTDALAIGRLLRKS